jgi:RND family efflux transporter MFP subunit
MPSFITLSRTEHPMTSKTFRLALLMLPLTLTIACGGSDEAAATLDSTAAAAVDTAVTTSDSTPVVALSVAPEHVTVVDTGLIEAGPSLSGTLNADRIADLRAQVAGTLLEVYVDEGAAVRTGQALARIDATVLDDMARSAASQLRSAEAAAAVATRNAERAQQLNAAGAIADRDLEASRNQAIAAEAMVADARSRLASARKQLANATLRAPFSGVVSERPANAGDVLQMGTPVITVIDPSSLELAASVPAASLSGMKRGAKVEFTVTGYPDRRFTGTIARVNPSVDPVTRQVRIYVAVPNADRSLAAGVFAEGRVAVSQVRGLSMPLGALDPQATAPSVKRLRGGVVELVPVSLGLRDDIAERVEVKSGLQRGDTLLISGALGAPVGSQVRIARNDR